MRRRPARLAQHSRQEPGQQCFDMDDSEVKRRVRSLSTDGGRRDEVKRPRLEDELHRDGHRRRRSRGHEPEGEEENRRGPELEGAEPERERRCRRKGDEGKEGNPSPQRDGGQEVKIKRERKSRWDVTTCDDEPTPFLMIHNLFDASSQDEEFFFQIEDDVHTQCAKEGAVLHAMHMDRKSGSLCLKCDSIMSAMAAKKIFDGKLRDGRTVSCTILKRETYEKRFGR